MFRWLASLIFVRVIKLRLFQINNGLPTRRLDMFRLRVRLSDPHIYRGQDFDRCRHVVIDLRHRSADHCRLNVSPNRSNCWLRWSISQTGVRYKILCVKLGDLNHWKDWIFGVNYLNFSFRSGLLQLRKVRGPSSNLTRYFVSFRCPILHNNFVSNRPCVDWL